MNVDFEFVEGVRTAGAAGRLVRVIPGLVVLECVVGVHKFLCLNDYKNRSLTSFNKFTDSQYTLKR